MSFSKDDPAKQPSNPNPLPYSKIAGRPGVEMFLATAKKPYTQARQHVRGEEAKAISLLDCVHVA